MATEKVTIKASPQAVFDVLADGWTYSNWVVGTSHIRAVDEHWPAAGAKLYHAVGPWPLVVRDETVIDRVQQNSEVVLIAKGFPLGDAKVTIQLEPDGDGCTVTMHEHPRSGPAKWFHNPLADAVLKRRNQESLSRLRATVERHTTG